MLPRSTTTQENRIYKAELSCSPGAPRPRKIEFTRQPEVDLLRVPRIDGHTKRGAVRLYPTVKALPGLPQVGAAQDATGGTAEILADTGVERIGIVGGSVHPARVGDGREFVEVQVVPGVPPVLTAPHTSPVGDADHVGAWRP